MKIKTVDVVIGANFGDEGKGLMTDYLANLRSNKDEETLVILHNGGSQRGHTVTTPEGKRHVFRHFGSGTYNNASTYLSEDFIVNPILFKKEYLELKKENIEPIVYINYNCKMTTIYDMLINQALEIFRGKDKHGSCGVGIYETIFRNRNRKEINLNFKEEAQYNSPYLALTVGEFDELNTFNKIEFLDTLRMDYLPKRLKELQIKELPDNLKKAWTSDNVLINFIDDFNFMRNNSFIMRKNYQELLKNHEHLIFEGGQGLLLDQNNIDYFPHLTPSNTGLTNPRKILKDMDYKGIVKVYYVTRTYMTRHGVGKFKTECNKEMINSNMIDFTNVRNPFQDNLRYGMLDLFDLEDRIIKDLRKEKDNRIYFIGNIVFTHTNEYNFFMRSYNRGWQNLLDNWSIKLFNGNTRNSIIDVEVEEMK